MECVGGCGGGGGEGMIDVLVDYIVCLSEAWWA